MIRCKILLPGRFRSVDLPDIGEPGNVMERFIRVLRAAFLQAVVHNHNARLESGKNARVSRVAAAVMSRQVDIDRPDQTPGTSEFEKRLTRQVTHIQEPEFPQRHEHPGRARVLERIIGFDRLGATQRVGSPRAAQRTRACSG